MSGHGNKKEIWRKDKVIQNRTLTSLGSIMLNVYTSESIHLISDILIILKEMEVSNFKQNILDVDV